MASSPSFAPDNLYRSYKKSTSSVVKWLISCSGASPEVSSMSLKDMKAAAQKVRASKTEIPSAIYWAFRDAISNRTLLTELHKSDGSESDDASNASHEHFTKLLKEIFDILFPKVKRSTAVSDRNIFGEKNTVANLYEVLDLEDLIDEEEEQHLYGEKPVKLLIEEDLRRQGFIGEEEDGAAITEDFLERHLRCKFYYDYQSELQEIFDKANEVWERADSSPWDLLIKAWLTNVAFASVQELSTMTSTFPERFGIPNHEEFLHRRSELISTMEENVGTLIKYDGTTTDRGSDFFGCAEAFNALQKFQTRKRRVPQSPNSQSIKVENPKDLVPIGTLPFKHIPNDERNTRCMLSMLETMASYEGGTGNPVQAPFHKYVANPAIGGTNVVLGMQLWISTFSTYLATTQGSPAVDCRIMVLRFAKSIQNAVRPLISHFSTQHLKSLRDLSHSLNVYLSDRRFDLYYRSPWVAGTHMSELLADVYGDSMPLIKHYGIITAVLHLYNVLIRLDMINPTDLQLLELLCGSLDEICFRGKRPESSFSENLVAAVGRSASDSKKPSRRQLPVHLPCASEHNRHFDMKKKHSTFYYLRRMSYRTNSSIVCQIYDEGESTKAVPLALEKLRGIAEAEFYFGQFPLVRTNWFAVYLLCVKILDRYMQLWQECHEDGDPACYGDCCTGVLGVGMTMELVDDWKNGVHKARSQGPLKELWELRLGRQALLECAKDLKPEDFQWSI
ncbi:uncharacterized protein BDZ99DRAFT_515012 [Mytilinidion resinicola]|uniref:DUF6604 domain-containing protein n=1 Tax=Mytilinidion resinicola TaxID=574789 RepID=A0A6A6Z6Y1_9PEZI|nr:uncharacterized protein BDZ99DRAFT_515012 [Mytilinidion resinicola]KAF2816423.1 hypothetical protein BDZ99DRAFT_515012 [Mytilinidion resinicola]